MPVSLWDGEKYEGKRVVVDGELIDAHALEYGADSDDVAKRYHAQVIDTTMGRGECKETMIDHFWRGCDMCGYAWEYMYGIGKCERPNYCPNCGAKVVDE